MNAIRTATASDIEIVPARQETNCICFDRTDRGISESVEEERIVIFRGAFTPDELLGVRTRIEEWGQSVKEFPARQSASRPSLNFHRRDDGTQASHLPHVFHIYGFADHASLPMPLRNHIVHISSMLMNLQNRIAGTQFDLTSGQYKTAVLRHPRGGGFLAKHMHPYLPQKIGLFLNLSEPGIDYTDGEVFFLLKGKRISTLADFRLGDILAWRYDREHGVSPIDAGARIDWSGDDGLWILNLEDIASHAQSRPT